MSVMASVMAVKGVNVPNGLAMESLWLAGAGWGWGRDRPVKELTQLRQLMSGMVSLWNHSGWERGRLSGALACMSVMAVNVRNGSAMGTGCGGLGLSGAGWGAGLCVSHGS